MTQSLNAKTTTARKTTKAKKAAAPAADQPTPELLLVDPATLIVGANVRVDVHLDPEFVDSIRERGVLEPIAVYRNGGDLVVLRGQKRTLGAIQAGRAVVPVYVNPKPEDVYRVVDQVIENVHRAGLTAGDLSAGYVQLAAFGVPAGEIAKRTASKPEAVNRALAVAASARARTLAEKYPALTFDNLAAVTEFEDDQKALEQLERAAKDGRGFAHTVQSLRDTRQQREARAAAEQALTDAGVKVIDNLHSRPKARSIDRLKGANTVEMTPEEHAACPGNAAVIDEDWLSPGDEGYPDPNAGDDAPEMYVAVPGYACLDFAKHGHEEIRPWSPSSGGTRTVAEMSEEERAAASAERKAVITGNKAWDSAQTVRRQWLTNLLARKTAPARAAAFVAASLIRRDHAVNHMLMNGIDPLREMLGMEPEGTPYSDYEGHQRRRRELVDLVEKATDGRALLLALGVVLAAYEQQADRMSWRRSPSVSSHDGAPDPTPRYLRYLESCGYELAPIERRACGEQVDEQTGQADA